MCPAYFIRTSSKPTIRNVSVWRSVDNRNFLYKTITNLSISFSSLFRQREELTALKYVLADKDAMFIVFRNLIDNAIKYTPQNGHVTVHVEQNGIYVKVKVKDTGIGMTPEEKSRVFEEFFRAKNDFTAHVPGTGLGLSLVKRLVDMHNGTITVESTVGEGTEFTVCVSIEG